MTAPEIMTYVFIGIGALFAMIIVLVVFVILWAAAVEFIIEKLKMSKEFIFYMWRKEAFERYVKDMEKKKGKV